MSTIIFPYEKRRAIRLARDACEARHFSEDLECSIAPLDADIILSISTSEHHADTWKWITALESSIRIRTRTMKVAPSLGAVNSLKALQSKVFGTTYNPTHARTGAKVLRQRLQGPS